MTGPGKGWRRIVDAPRDASGRIKRPSKAKWRGKRISPEDLAAGIYPPEDVRNQPDVAVWIEPFRKGRTLTLPRGLTAIWLARGPCDACGAAVPFSGPRRD